MAALFDVHLKKIPEVVERRAGFAQLALLLDRRGLGVALRDDDAAQAVAELAGHLLIDRLAVVVAEAHGRARIGGLEEDAPAVVGHLHVVEVRPAVRLDADRRAQVNVLLLEAVGTHLAPPVEVVGQPLFQRALEPLVFRQVDVVRDALVEIHAHDYFSTSSLRPDARRIDFGVGV